MPFRVLSRLYRRLFLSASGSPSMTVCPDSSAISSLRRRSALEWVVNAKRPFAGPEQVLAYPRRYTHRVAIADNGSSRVSVDVSVSGGRTRAPAAKTKVMTLEVEEFNRRFQLHVLPEDPPHPQLWLPGKHLPRHQARACSCGSPGARVTSTRQTYRLSRALHILTGCAPCVEAA
jgi:hypothetical protein